MNGRPDTHVAQEVHEPHGFATRQAEFACVSDQDRLVFQDQRNGDRDAKSTGPQQAE
jgi:hypothetical protein